MNSEKFEKEIIEMMVLVNKLNQKGEKLVFNLRATSVDVFDASDNCKQLSFGEYGGSVYLNFEDVEQQLENAINYLKMRLKQSEGVNK